MRESEAKTNSIKLEFYTITVEFPYRSVSENFPLEKRYIEITVCIQSAKIIAWLFSPNRHKGDTISKILLNQVLHNQTTIISTQVMTQ